MLIDKIKELNTELYKAFAELKENKDHISNPKHIAGIANKIYELYELDYELIREDEMREADRRADEIEIEKLARAEELKRRRAILTPICRRRRILFWKWYTNRAEDLFEGEACVNADKFLSAKEEALQQLQEAIRAADEAEVSETLEEPISREELRQELLRQEREEQREQRRLEREERKAEKQAAKAAKKAAKKNKDKQEGKPQGGQQENEETPEKGDQARHRATYL